MKRVWAVAAATGVCVGVAGMLASQRLWFEAAGGLIQAFGAAANFAALYANEGRMPCVGCTNRTVPETKTHRALLPQTRLKPLCDIFDVGFGYASIGDFVMTAGLATTLLSLVLDRHQ